MLKENQHNFPLLRVGDTVRVARSTDGEWRRARQLKKYAYLSQWFFELYKVMEITKRTSTKNPKYKLLGPDGKEIPRWFLPRQIVLGVPDATALHKWYVR